MKNEFRPADPFGIQRVVVPAGRSVLPQQAEKLDPSLPLAEDELLIDVESLSVDSASFLQITSAYQGDLARIEKHVLELVERRGKLHNPVTGSGGMLVGRVAVVGPSFPVQDKPVKVGDRIATLVSLSLTPMALEKIHKIHPTKDRIDARAQAILFASGVFARIPDDIPETVALAALDVAGAPAQTLRLVRENQTVVVIGGGGKSGLLCLYQAKRKLGVRTVAVDFSQDALERLSELSFVDEVIQSDARDAIGTMEKVWAATKGHMGDLVINAANVPETEMASILSCRRKGTVYFFNMATHFTRAVQGAEGVGMDIDLRIGNGYAEGHAELVFEILRDSPELNRLFTELYS
jgi:L-erythro-3,5-diaminohexanoate dehydrogenase